MPTPEDDIEAKNRAKIRHLEYLKKFTENFLKINSTLNGNKSKQLLLAELLKYRESPDPEVKQVAEFIAQEVYWKFLQYPNPERVIEQAPDKFESAIRQLNQIVDPMIAKAKKSSADKRSTAFVSSSTQQRATSTPTVSSLQQRTTPEPKQTVTTISPYKAADIASQKHNEYRVARVALLDNTIQNLNDQIKQYEASNKEFHKAAYKSVKSKALSFLGKQHVSKLDIAKQLRSELLNIRKAAENVNPLMTTTQLTDHVQASLNKSIALAESTNNPIMQSIVKDLSMPYQFSARVITDKAFDNIIKHINDKYGQASVVFGSHVQELSKTDRFKDDSVYRSDPPADYDGRRTQAYDNLGVGDFLAVHYPFPLTTGRDDLIIQAVNKLDHNHELVPIAGFIDELNTLRKTIEDIVKLPGSKKELADAPMYMELYLNSFDSSMMQLNEAAQKLKDPTIKEIVSSLSTLKEKVLEQLPDNLKPKVTHTHTK